MIGTLVTCTFIFSEYILYNTAQQVCIPNINLKSNGYKNKNLLPLCCLTFLRDVPVKLRMLLEEVLLQEAHISLSLIKQAINKFTLQRRSEA